VLPGWFLNELRLGLALGLSIGLTAGLMSGLALGLVGNASTHQMTKQPSQPMRQIGTYEIVVGLVLGLTVTLMFGLAGWFTGAFASWLASGLASGLTFGLCLRLMESFWPRYTVTVRSLHRTDRLPRQLGQFLDWAYTAGLVRLADTATQFRHRDLQTHLTSTDNTTPIDTIRTSPHQTTGDTQHPAT
jgi:F0F1-type ATP synthase membrane subunit c/vacuolar-type H+-ATPase subunit K